VSENDDSHCAGTTKVEVTSQGKERLKRKAFKRPRKTDIEGADVTCRGRLFQVRAAETGKTRSSTVDSRVRGTVSDDEEVERSRLRASESAEHWSLSSIDEVGWCRDGKVGHLLMEL